MWAISEGIVGGKRTDYLGLHDTLCDMQMQDKNFISMTVPEVVYATRQSSSQGLREQVRSTQLLSFPAWT